MTSCRVSMGPFKVDGLVFPLTNLLISWRGALHVFCFIQVFVVSLTGAFPGCVAQILIEFLQAFKRFVQVFTGT